MSNSFFPIVGSWEPNSGLLTWQKAPFPNEPSYLSLGIAFESYSFIEHIIFNSLGKSYFKCKLY